MRIILVIAMLLAGVIPASARQIPCYLVGIAIKWTGSEAAAIQLATSRGYSQVRINEALKRCAKKPKSANAD